MSPFAKCGFLRFFLLAGSFLVVPAFAQFEIAPDHFDGSGQQAVTHKPSVKTERARAATSLVAHRRAVAATANAEVKRNESRRPQIARQSKTDVAVATSRR